MNKKNKIKPLFETSTNKTDTMQGAKEYIKENNLELLSLE